MPHGPFDRRADDSPIRASHINELQAALETTLRQSEAVASVGVRRIVASTDPYAPITDGDLLLIYAHPQVLSEDFADGLTGWTARWNSPGTWVAVADATATGGMAARNTGGVFGRRILTSDEIGTAATPDAELLARIKLDQVSSNISAATAGLVLRASGDTVDANNYLCGYVNDQLVIGRTVGGSYSHLVQTPFAGLTVDAWFWLRFRAQGAGLLVKAWLDGATEPDTWTASVSDSTHAEGGWVGLFASDDAVQTWDVVVVALDGATATIPAGG